MSSTFHRIVQLFAVRGIHDTQCGFKCYSGEVAHELFEHTLLYRTPEKALKGPAVTGFDVELLFLAQKMGYRIREVPVEWYYFEATSVRPVQDSLRNLGDVIRIRLNDWQGRYRYTRAGAVGELANRNMRGSAPEK